MRIAFFVNVFPPKYETFILSQVSGMIQRGCQVDVIARRRGATGGADKGPADTGPADTGPADTGPSDTGPSDTGPSDTGPSDTGPSDTGPLADKGPANNDKGPADKGPADRIARHVRYRPRIPDGRIQRRCQTMLLALRRPGLLGSTLARLVGRSTAGGSLVYDAEPFSKCPPHDVIFCAYGPLGNLAVRLKEAGIIQGRIVTAFRGADLSKGLHEHPAMYDRLFEHADLLLPVSQEFQQRLVEHGCRADKIVVHHDSVDCSRFPFFPRELARHEPLRLVSVGRLIEKKGFEFAIRSVARLKTRYPQVELRIVGDGPLAGSLRTLVRSLDVTNQVSLLGWRTHAEVQQELRRAHIMWQPSVTASDGEQEGIPTVLKEALATGLLAVATRHSGNAELVEDGVSGYLVPERDAEALAQRTLDLIERAPQWPAMARAGRAFVEDQFDESGLNDRLFATLQALTRGSRVRLPAEAHAS